MEKRKTIENKTRKNRFIAFFALLGLVVAPAVVASQFIKPNAIKVDAADYSGVSSGFVHNGDGSVTATFTVTNNSLDMKGWLLCLFPNTPSVDSNNKLTNSNDAHPYSSSEVSHYYFASSTAKTGTISVTWAADANDQKTYWSADECSASDHGTASLSTCLSGDTNWNLVIGPRHYNTGWGDSGIGAGTNGYWENCDYYVGAKNDVFDDEVELKDMNVSWGGAGVGYDGEPHTGDITVYEPSEYTIKYKLSPNDDYTLEEMPEFVDAGDYTIYFLITAEGYNDFEGTISLQIQKSFPSMTEPTAVTGLVYDGSAQTLVTGGSDNLVYSLDSQNYSEDLPTAIDAGEYTVYYMVPSSNNYNQRGPYELNVSIAKADPIYTAPSAIEGLRYTGGQQDLIEAGSENVLYSIDGVIYTSEIPTAVEVGTYTVYYKVEETANYYGIEPESIEISIDKADPIYTEPIPVTGLVYNGENQPLIAGGSANISYSFDNEEYSNNIPEAKDAGTYTIYYRVDETDTTYGVEAQSFEVSISKADPIYTAPVAIEGLIYNGQYQNLVEPGSSNIIYSLDNEEYSSEIPTAIDAGTYHIYYKVEEDPNYNSVEGDFEVSIAKAIPVYDEPTAIEGLVYNQQEQALVTPGSENVLYSLDNEDYSSEVPTAKDAGTYTVYYKVVETPNFEGDGPKTIDVNIAKADAEYTDIPSAILDLFYTSESQILVNPGSSTGGTILYSLDGENYSEELPERKLVGDYTVYYKIEGDDNYNGVDVASFDVSISPNDKTDLNDIIERAQNYSEVIISDYYDIASELDNAIIPALAVQEDDNQTVEEIATATENLVLALDVAHANVCDALIIKIGEVRYTEKCLQDIINAESEYALLSENQKEMVENLEILLASRDLYDRLHAAVTAINAIGNVTLDSECLSRINAAIEAYSALNEEEGLLIPTYFNKLNSAKDIYHALEVIDALGEAVYTEEYKAALDNARHIYDALDSEEQVHVYNSSKLFASEDIYNHVNNVVKLVDNIPDELEYVGTQEPNIERARKAYEELTEQEKKLVPEATVRKLTLAIERYEFIKVENEQREIEDTDAGVNITTEGGSGIPETVVIDINNAQSSDEDMKDNIDYQTIEETVNENESISSITEIKFYEEVNGEIVEVSLEQIDENMSLVVKIDVPADVDDTSFKIVLLDADNNVTEMEYTYDPSTRQATVITNKVGTFAVIAIHKEEEVKMEELPGAIIGAVAATAAIASIAYLSIFKGGALLLK